MDRHFGTHIAHIIEDIIYIRCMGDLSPEALGELLAIVDEVIAQHGRYGAVIDASQMGSVHPATRRLLSEWQGSKHCYGNAVFGQAFALRVSLTMAMRAVQLFTRRPFPVAFFGTAKEAEAWLKVRGEQARR